MNKQSKDEQTDLFEKIGFDISKDKINIDINQTKDFFSTLVKTFEGAAQNLGKGISEGKVDMSENVGIKVDKDNINIDLEKAKSFMEDFGKKIEDFMAEIDTAVKNIDKK